MNKSKLNPAQLESISQTTLTHYQTRATQFFQGTKDHDVSQNIDSLLRAITTPQPWRILDLGCGPGRDLLTFKTLGHEAIGLDGAAAFCTMAQQLSGCEVWQQDFLQLELPVAYFSGMFANATLFHVPTQELPRVLRQLHNSLVDSGVLLTSNPHGNDEEGWHGQRFGAYHTLTRWRRYLETAGFEYLEHYYRPTGLPREQQPWLVTLWRKTG